MAQFVREINDAVKIKLALDSRGLPLRDEHGFPIIEEELLYAYGGPKTLSPNCHAEDRQVEVIRNEYWDEWY